MSPAFARAVNVAFYCLVAQLFLSLAGLIVAGSILSLLAWDPSIVVMIPVAAFAIYVGLSALRRARDVMAGSGPLV